MMLVNLDASMEKREFAVDDNFSEIIPIGVLNRSPESLWKLFNDFGLDPPECIHENFIFVLLGSKKVALPADYVSNKEASILDMSIKEEQSILDRS